MADPHCCGSIQARLLEGVASAELHLKRIGNGRGTRSRFLRARREPIRTAALLSGWDSPKTTNVFPAVPETKPAPSQTTPVVRRYSQGVFGTSPVRTHSYRSWRRSWPGR